MGLADAARCMAIAAGVAMASAAAAQQGSVESAADAGANGRRVDILNYRVEGNTVLPRTAVERAVMPYLGPQRSTADVESARASLEKAYRDAGYETVAVEIPEQDVRGGIVFLNVTELKVGRLRVRNADWYSPRDIKSRAPSLAEGNVPNYRDVQRDIEALNKSTDRTITPSLRAGDTPGTVDVDLEVEDHIPLHASLEFNDRASAQTTRTRVAGTLRYTNLFQRDHSISVQGQFAPEDPGQSAVVSGTYVAPIGGSPFTIVAYGVHSDSNVAAIGGIDVIGSGDIVGLRGIYSFRGGEGVFHTLTLGADYKSFNEDLLLGSDRAATPISYIPLTLQYAFARRTPSWDLDLNVALNFGIRGLEARDAEFQLKRDGASASWASLRFDASYARRWAHDIRTQLRFSGQIAGQPLISNEQFSAGGLESVRGYYESQMLADDGASAQLDLISPSLLGNRDGARPYDLRVFAFADAAVLRTADTVFSGPASTASLVSVGGGLNARFYYLNASTLLAFPLRHPEATITDVGDARVQFRLWAEF